MNDKTLLGIAVILLVIGVVMVAPIIEVTLYNKDGVVISQSIKRILLPGSQSLIPLVTEEVDRAEVKIVKQNYREIWECDNEIPTTLKEIKEVCDYVGRDST